MCCLKVLQSPLILQGLTILLYFKLDLDKILKEFSLHGYLNLEKLSRGTALMFVLVATSSSLMIFH